MDFIKFTWENSSRFRRVVLVVSGGLAAALIAALLGSTLFLMVAEPLFAIIVISMLSVTALTFFGIDYWVDAGANWDKEKRRKDRL